MLDHRPDLAGHHPPASPDAAVLPAAPLAPAFADAAHAADDLGEVARSGPSEPDAPVDANLLDASEVAVRLDDLLREVHAADVPMMLNDLGALQAVRGDLDAAEGHLRCAHLLAPDHAEIDRNLQEIRAMRAASIGGRAAGHQPAPVDPPSPTGGRVGDPFAGHYFEWRRRRIAAIVERYGAGWFRGARVLELGCGFGDIGASFLTLGADVTFSEGRAEHLGVIAGRYPGIASSRLVAYDAEDPWPFADRFDLVINMGLVYHVDNWQRSIVGSVRAADRVVLETEVCDSDDPNLVVKIPEVGEDQAISGTGSRPSGAAVEALLRAEGCRFERITDSRCNAAFHRYDWSVTGSGGWEHGLRRFWFVWRPGTLLPQ